MLVNKKIDKLIKALKVNEIPFEVRIQSDSTKPVEITIGGGKLIDEVNYNLTFNTSKKFEFQDKDY